MIRLTSDLKHKYGYPEIVPGGIPVDLDAAARRQHEAAMGEAPAQPSLVQILPAQPAPVVRPSEPAPAATAEPETRTPSEQPGEDGLPAERPFSESDTEFPR